MTREQYARWKEFSTAMALRGFTDKSGRPLPKKSAARIKASVDDFFEMLENNWEWDFLALIVNWDRSASHPTKKDYSGVRYEHGPCICDEADRYAEELFRLTQPWNDRMQCCIRAGLDVAVAPSGGVVGFTAGDIRRMWNGEVPEWVKAEFGFDAIPDSTYLWM